MASIELRLGVADRRIVAGCEEGRRRGLSGHIAKQGAMTGVVTATGSKTFFGRTAKLVGAAGAVSHSQRAVTQAGDFLLLLAFVLAAILVGVQRHLR